MTKVYKQKMAAKLLTRSRENFQVRVKIPEQRKTNMFLSQMMTPVLLI